MVIERLYLEAKRGNPQAIASIVELALRPRRIVCEVRLAGPTLHLKVASVHPLPRDALVRALKRGFERMRPQGVQFVLLKATGPSARVVAWETRIVLPAGQPGSEPAARVRCEARPRRFRAVAAAGLIACATPFWAIYLAHWATTPEPAAPLVAHRSPPPAKAPPAAENPTAHPPPFKEVAPIPPRAEPEPAPEIDVAAAAPPEPPMRLRIKAVGDILPGTDYPAKRLFSAQQAGLLATIQGLTEGADLVFGNLETSLTDHTDSRKGRHSPNVYSFRTPPRYAAWLKAAGFDLLSIANNHSLDFGRSGFSDTLRHLTEAGIQPVGEAGRITYRASKGRVIAFLGFTHSKGLNSVHDLAAAKALVDQANAKADLVVVSIHAGAEGAGAQHLVKGEEFYLGEARGDPVRLAHALVDRGADLILGHGPHVPRAMELYRGRLIAYSLGNFLGYGGLSARGPNGLSLVLDAELSADGTFLAGQIISARLNRQGLPQLDPEARTIRLIRRLMIADITSPGLTIEETGGLGVVQALADLNAADQEGI